MDDAVEALYMSAAVLLLLIALTVSISAFTKVKIQVEQINEQETGIELAKDDSGNYINYFSESNGNRIVGADTVISSIRRISRESYTIYISGNATKVSEYDYEKENINGIKYLILSTAGTNYKNLDEKIEEIYTKIKGKTFEEKIGIFQEKTADGVSSANKQTHRIITYEEQ